MGAIGHMDWKLGYGVWVLRFLQLFSHGSFFDVEVVDDGLDDSCRHRRHRVSPEVSILRHEQFAQDHEMHGKLEQHVKCNSMIILYCIPAHAKQCSLLTCWSR